MTREEMTKSYYRPDEVAMLFSISRRTVYRLIQSQALKAIKIRGSVRVSRDELLRYARQNRFCCAAG